MIATEPAYAWCQDDAVAYQVVGTGPPDVLAILGLPTNLEADWDDAANATELKRLGTVCRLVRFDKRGTGLSQSATAIGTDAWTEDALAVLDAVGLERVSIWGHGLGSPTAIAFAARHPDRVDRLALSLPFARLAAADDGYPGLPVEFFDDATELVRTQWGTGVLMDLIGVAHDDDSRRRVGRYERLAATPQVAAELVRLLADLDLRQEVAAIQAPTLVVYQTNPVLAHEHASFLAEHIPNARLETIDIDPAGWRWRTDSADIGPIFDVVTEFLTGQLPEVPLDERALVTALFTDIVDSTMRADALGDDRWSALIAEHNHLVREELRRFHGREVRMTGDGVFAVFDVPARAVRCAISIRDNVQRLGIAVRAGLHTGEAAVDGSDYAGIAIHVAARVSAAARAGQVLVSHTVPDLVAGSSLRFELAGEHTFKGVPGTWRVFEAST